MALISETPSTATTLVTAPQTLADALPDLEARQQVAHAMSEGLTVHDHNGAVIWFNAAACRLLKVSPEELLGTVATDPCWRCVDANGYDIAPADIPVARCLAGRVPVKHVLLRAETGARDHVWLDVSASPITRSGLPGVICVFRDVTDERDLRHDLEQTVVEINRTLVQRSLPGDGKVQFAWKMLSTTSQSAIGGDFLGAHQIDEKRYGFFIGDVCGHGAQSAGVSALARHTMGTAGVLLDNPSQVLSHVHRVLESEWPDTYLTAMYGYIDVHPDRLTVRLSIGGHPRPVLIGADETRHVGTAGPIIGMVNNTPRPVDSFDLYPGDRLVLFSDGLTDTRLVQVDPLDLLRVIKPRTRPDQVAELAVELSQSEAYWHQADDDVAVLVVGFD